MPEAVQPRSRQSLRAEAEQRLKARTGLPPSTSSASSDALAALYQLVSEPSRAGDVLKLLHELQVHQVELDLQFHQLAENELELSQTLARYQTFYEYAPVGYLAVGFDGHIIEGNLAAARLLGVEPHQFDGRRLDSFLAEGCAGTLIELLTKLHSSRVDGADASCEVRPATSGSSAPSWQIAANVLAGGDAVLLVISEHNK